MAKRPLYLLLLVGLAIGCTAGQSLGVPVGENPTSTQENPSVNTLTEEASSDEPPAPPPTTTVPSSDLHGAADGMPDEEWEEIEEDIRSGVVEIFVERGMSREEAEVEADQRMAEGVEVGVMEEQIEIYEDWIRNYQDHPVLGIHWTEDDAECVIFTMLQKSGIRETGQLLDRASRGGMSETDAESLVRPVADCVDMKEMVRVEMVKDPAATTGEVDCVLRGITEEQVASWYIADFTDGAAGMKQAFRGDLDWSCLTTSTRQSQ